eukprot:sb/3467817/
MGEGDQFHWGDGLNRVDRTEQNRYYIINDDPGILPVISSYPHPLPRSPEGRPSYQPGYQLYYPGQPLQYGDYPPVPATCPPYRPSPHTLPGSLPAAFLHHLTEPGIGGRPPGPPPHTVTSPPTPPGMTAWQPHPVITGPTSSPHPVGTQGRPRPRPPAPRHPLHRPQIFPQGRPVHPPHWSCHCAAYTTPPSGPERWPADGLSLFCRCWPSPTLCHATRHQSSAGARVEITLRHLFWFEREGRERVRESEKIRKSHNRDSTHRSIIDFSSDGVSLFYQRVNL